MSSKVLDRENRSSPEHYGIAVTRMERGPQPKQDRPAVVNFFPERASNGLTLPSPGACMSRARLATLALCLALPLTAAAEDMPASPFRSRGGVSFGFAP